MNYLIWIKYSKNKIIWNERNSKFSVFEFSKNWEISNPNARSSKHLVARTTNNHVHVIKERKDKQMLAYETKKIVLIVTLVVTRKRDESTNTRVKRKRGRIWNYECCYF